MSANKCSLDSSCAFCYSIAVTLGVRLCGFNTMVWFRKVSSPSSGKSPNLLVRAAGVSPYLRGRYMIFKLNWDRNVANLAL